jgi:hypothetical protein
MDAGAFCSLAAGNPFVPELIRLMHPFFPLKTSKATQQEERYHFVPRF